MTSTAEDLNSLKNCVRALSKVDTFCLDLETTGLNPRKDRIRGVALATDTRQWYFECFGDDKLPLSVIHSELKPILLDGSKICVGHNLKFDLQFLSMNRIEVNCKIADSMILAHLVDDNRAGSGRLSLKGKGGLVDELFGIVLEEWEESGLAGTLFGKPERDYAMDDVKYTLMCYYKLLGQIRRQDGKADSNDIGDLEKFFWDVSMPMVRILAEMELSGIMVDVEYLRDYEKALQKESEEIEKQIVSAAGRPLKVGSTEDLSRFLFEDKDGPKLTPKPWMVRGKKGFYSTAEDVLSHYSQECTIADLVLEWRGKQKLLTTYVQPFIELATQDEGHRIYTSLGQAATVTGRLNSSNPNLQNIPRPNKKDKFSMRSAFVAPEGKLLIDADFGQLELRIMAHQSRDEAMMKVYLENGDIHDATQKALGLEERAVAKGANFGLIYGLSAQGLKDDLWSKARLDKTVEECSQWRYGFFTAYPNIPRYHKQVEHTLTERKYIRTLAGRRRRLGVLLQSDYNQALRMAINATIQGSAADIVMIAMRNFWRRCRKNELLNPRWREVRMLLQVHDELLVECPEDMVPEVEAAMKEDLENCVKLRVPLESTPKHGKNWRAAK